MKRVTVYATSDLHAHWDRRGGGMGRVLSALDGRDRHTSVLIDNGDLLTGSVLGAYLADREWSAGHPILSALEGAGFDVAVPGNHDLDHGIDRLREAVSALTTLNYVCANLVDAESGDPVFPPSAVVERGGVRVGVVGAITSHMQRLTRFDAVRGVRAIDAVRAVRTEVSRLRADVDVLVVAYHGGFAADPQTGDPWHYETGEDQASRMLSIEGVDGLIAGHQHWARVGVVEVARGDVAYAQPGYAGDHIGRLQFGVDDQGRVEGAADLVSPAEQQPDAANPLARLATQAEQWLNSEAALDDDAVHAAVADRSGCKMTALLLPRQPRTWAQLAAAFPGIYGVSIVELPTTEFESLVAADAQIGVRGACSAEQTRLVAVNAPLVSRGPEGRVRADLVVDWLDELVWAERGAAVPEENCD